MKNRIQSIYWWRLVSIGILVINQLSYIIANRTLELRFGNRRATAKAKPHVLGTFRFWNNLPTTLCAIGLSLRMTTKTSSKNPSIDVFFLWNLPYLGGFQHRMWFLLYDVDTNIIQHPPLGKPPLHFVWFFHMCNRTGRKGARLDLHDVWL